MGYDKAVHDAKKLKAHAAHHSRAHMAQMRRKMRAGHSFAQPTARRSAPWASKTAAR